MLPVFTNSVARPSTVLKSNYNQFANLFFNHVNKVLINEEAPQDALKRIELGRVRLLR
jgi:hypothetical protein